MRKFRWLGYLALALGLLTSAAASFIPRASAQRAPCAQSGSPAASFSLDGVELELCTAFIPSPAFSTPNPTDAIQMATAVDRSAGYLDFSITAVPFGLRSPADDLPAAQAGGADAYRALLKDYRTQQGGRPQPGPAALLFGQVVTSTVSVVNLPVDDVVAKPVAIAEWVVEAGSRIWMIRASRLSQAQEPEGLWADVELTSPDVNQPSTSLAAFRNPAAPVSPSQPNVSSASVPDLPVPAWWYHNGNYEVCDASHYAYPPDFAGSPQNPSHRTSYPLGNASYRGVQACGPRPYYDSAPDVIVQFFSGSWGEYEWECVELSMRFMRQAYGIAPYSGNGKDVVWNYSGSELVKVVNGTAGQVPAPGDVLSYCNGCVRVGHTAVVAASNVNSSGNGTITVIEQNNSASGWNTLSVSNWSVGSGVTGWLHFPGNGSVSGMVKNSAGQPVAGQLVTLEKWLVSRTAITDGNGAYSFDDIPAGSASVSAASSNDCGSAAGAITASIVAHQNQPAPDLVMGDLLGSVSGVVNNLYGQPVPGAQVELSKCGSLRTATTDGNGAYAFTGLSTGPASVRAYYSNGNVYAEGTTATTIVANQNQSLPDFFLNLPPFYAAGFVADVTFPDQAVFSPAQPLVKTWRLRNTGALTWGSGYQLVFLHGDKMDGAETVNVPYTPPGQTADFTVNLTAPLTGTHFGWWRLRNPQGVYFGPTLFPQVTVQTPSPYLTLQVSPASPADASGVRIYARVDGLPYFRALRLKVDGAVVTETQAAELYYTWNTGGYSAVGHSLVAEAADWTDAAWAHPERRGVVYTLTGSAGAAHFAPSRPTLLSPADWSAITSTVQLCAPGGDAGLQYQFEISGTVGAINSGWITSCYAPAGLNPGTYQWRVKTRDSAQVESLWSATQHFSYVTGDPAAITRFDLEPLDPAAEQVRVWACTSLTVPVTVSVRVNTSADGAGRWDVIGERATPCVVTDTAPIWNTLPYADGAHLLRVVAVGVSPARAVMSDTVFTLAPRRPLTPTLLAPLARSGDLSDTAYLNSRTVGFRWAPAARAISYTLLVSVNPSPLADANPLVRQTLSGSTAYTATLDGDYALLYWQVVAANASGASASDMRRLGIDRTAPSCTVQAPPLGATPPFQVSWTGADDRAGVSAYYLRYFNGGYLFDWLFNLPATATSAQFYGQPGQNYGFYCVAADQAGNLSALPPGIFVPLVFK